MALVGLLRVRSCLLLVSALFLLLHSESIGTILEKEMRS